MKIYFAGSRLPKHEEWILKTGQNRLCSFYYKEDMVNTIKTLKKLREKDELRTPSRS